MLQVEHARIEHVLEVHVGSIKQLRKFVQEDPQHDPVVGLLPLR